VNVLFSSLWDLTTTLVVLISVPPALALLPPAFSLIEVRALVPAALDFDSPAPPLALSLDILSPSLRRKRSTHNLHTPPSASRVQLLLTELKKRTAALIMRRRCHLATTALRASVIMPCNLDRSSGGDSLLAPYLSLAAHYECGLPVSSS
jgi:hypothetical protein